VVPFEEKLSVSEVVIAVENLSKRYFIKQTLGGEGRSRYTACAMSWDMSCSAWRAKGSPSPVAGMRRETVKSKNSGR
jgi:hypothetical protein